MCSSDQQFLASTNCLSCLVVLDLLKDSRVDSTIVPLHSSRLRLATMAMIHSRKRGKAWITFRVSNVFYSLINNYLSFVRTRRVSLRLFFFFFLLHVSLTQHRRQAYIIIANWRRHQRQSAKNRQKISSNIEQFITAVVKIRKIDGGGWKNWAFFSIRHCVMNVEAFLDVKATEHEEAALEVAAAVNDDGVSRASLCT